MAVQQKGGTMSSFFPNRRRLLVAAAAVCSVTMAALATAQSYPSKRITLIVPFSVGSAGDVGFRVVAQKISENVKQAIVIDNQPNVSGLLGTERVAKAPPDGYLIGGLGDAVLNFSANLVTTNFDPVNGFQPIGLIATVPWALVANPSFGHKTLSEFVAAARASPGKIDYSSAGNGSASHIGMEMFAAQAKIRLHHVPYKGVTPAVNDAAGGQVQAVLAAVSLVMPFIKSGRLVALGMPAEKRSPFMPDVPTFTEAGMPGFTFVTWLGFFAPKGTPRAIVDVINAESGKAVADAGVRDRLVGLGLDPATSTPEELGERVRIGHDRVAKIIRDANIKAE
jgi:tripartite-type tricarboxylate transporter receptor subunit TctC